VTALLEADPGVFDDLNRRRFLGWGAAGVVAAGLGGCSTGGSTATPLAAAPGFPVSVEGRFGPTVVPAPPERVVTLGYGPDTGTVLALGVTPVGIARDNNVPEGVDPWVSALGPAPELIQTLNGMPFEQIAALRPDLIVATSEYSLAQTHADLAKIAPVLAYGSAPNTDPWQDTTHRIAQVLGKVALADQKVQEVQQRIARARADNPRFAGRTFSFGPVTADGVVRTTRSTTDLSAVFLQQLGLTLSPKAQALPESSTKGKAVVSPELLDAIDADVLILTYTSADAAMRTRLEADPLFQNLPAVRRGSYIALEVPTAIAIAFPSVLSLEYALDHVVGLLAGAIR
jgi:iron complex transport system substrate-binding protein